MICCWLLSWAAHFAAADEAARLQLLEVDADVFLGIVPKHLESAQDLASFSLVIDLRYPYEGVYDERGRLGAAGVTHVNLPTSSHGPDRETIDDLGKTLEAHRGEKILIHDSNGYRSAMTWAAYRVHQGWDQDRALADVRGLRDDPTISAAIEKYAANLDIKSGD